jgi:hypothetical protein
MRTKLENNIKNIGIIPKRHYQHQWVPKNSIIFFLTFIYRWSYYFLYKSYISFFPEKRVVIIDAVAKYIETNKIKLLESFHQCDINVNTNIEKIFYDKKELQQFLLNQNNELEKVWKTRILIENTPRGNIIMYYDVYKQGFAYYCDTNGIPYPILNSVAMKYVRLYHCRDFFMDNEVLLNEKESPLIKIHQENDEETAKDKSEKIPLDTSAFARLKNYKQIDTKNTSEKNMGNGERCALVKEYNRNIFINLGKVCNFYILQKIIKKSKLNGFYSSLLDGVTSESNLQQEVMNYSKYKELLKNRLN